MRWERPGPGGAELARGCRSTRGRRWRLPPLRCPEGPAGETQASWGAAAPEALGAFEGFALFYFYFFPFLSFFLSLLSLGLFPRLLVPCVCPAVVLSLAAPSLRACPGPTASAPRALAAPRPGQAPSSTGQPGAKQTPGPMATPTLHLPTGPRARRPPACLAGGGARKTTSPRQAGAAGRAAAG